jgi:hypothetical protein
MDMKPPPEIISQRLKGQLIPAYLTLTSIIQGVALAFLASELFMAHFVYDGLRNWLLSLGLTFVVGTIASIVTTMQARTFPEENRDVARALTPLNWVRAVLSMIILVLCLVAWALYDVLGLEQLQVVIALVALVAMIVFLGSSVPYWNRILAYARGDYRKVAD